MISDEINSRSFGTWFTRNIKSQIYKSQDACTAARTWPCFCLAVAINIGPAAIIKTAVFLDLTPCRLVDVKQKIFSRERGAVVLSLLVCARLTFYWNIDSSFWVIRETFQWTSKLQVFWELARNFPTDDSYKSSCQVYSRPPIQEA
jgi:hypothetical protein